MKTRIFSLALMLGISLGLFSQSAYQPTQENLKARQEFQDNKFGMQADFTPLTSMQTSG